MDVDGLIPAARGDQPGLDLRGAGYHFPKLEVSGGRLMGSGCGGRTREEQDGEDDSS